MKKNIIILFIFIFVITGISQNISKNTTEKNLTQVEHFLLKSGQFLSINFHNLLFLLN